MSEGAARMQAEGDGPRTVSEQRRVIADLRRELRLLRAECESADLSDLKLQGENALLRLRLLEVCEERDELIRKCGARKGTRKGAGEEASGRK